jgi:hypothetical protein
MKIIATIIILAGVCFAQNVDSLMQTKGAVKIAEFTSPILGDTIQYINYDRDARFDLIAKTVSYGCRAYNKQGIVLFEYPKVIQNNNLWSIIANWAEAITAQKNQALNNVSIKGNGIGVDFTEIGYE